MAHKYEEYIFYEFTNITNTIFKICKYGEND